VGEIIRDGETGVLFGTGNVRQLADMTLQLAAAPLRRARIGIRAREAAQAHAVDAIIAKYSECLVQVVGRCRRQIEALP
jgi:hypothetical protein